MIVEETLSKCEIKLELTNSEAALQNTKYIWLINQPIVGVESRCLTSCVQLLSMAEAMLNTIFEESSQTRQPSEGLVWMGRINQTIWNALLDLYLEATGEVR